MVRKTRAGPSLSAAAFGHASKYRTLRWQVRFSSVTTVGPLSSPAPGAGPRFATCFPCFFGSFEA